MSSQPPTRLMLVRVESFLDLAALQYLAMNEVTHYWEAMTKGPDWAELAGDYMGVERIN